MKVFDQKYFNLLKNFVIINLGLDPDLDWIRTGRYSGTGLIRIGIQQNTWLWIRIQ